MTRRNTPVIIPFLLAAAPLLLALSSCLSSPALAAPYFVPDSVLPADDVPHEGTWLQWPHHFTYGITYRNRLDPTWVAMTGMLVAGEKVHIIAYNSTEQARIQNLLTAASVPLTNVTFLIRQNNDCWVRDNGPVFVFDSANANALTITDWRFNGWGMDAPFTLDDTVPVAVAAALAVPRIDLSTIVIEGGSIEVDGHGALMATRSSILEPDRNPGLTQAQLEPILAANFGVSKFIWLDGAPGGSFDITDTHIDGFARFGPGRTIITMSAPNLSYWGISSADIATLYAATDSTNIPYSFVQLPLSANNVVTTYGLNLGFKGSYVNYYVANTVVLMPTYNDPNDNVAKSILQQLFPGRTVLGIDNRNLYAEGGMVHCVTQQQPVPFSPGDLNADGNVNIDDLTLVILNWGIKGSPGDADNDNDVDIDDLTLVILNWSP